MRTHQNTTIRFKTEEEHQALRDAARRADRTVSSYIRRIVLEQLRREGFLERAEAGAD